MALETMRNHFAITGPGILVTGMIGPKGFGQVTVDAKSSGAAAAKRVERLLQSFPAPNGRGASRYFTYFFAVKPLPKDALKRIEAAVGARKNPVATGALKAFSLGKWHPVASLADASWFIGEQTKRMGFGEWYERSGGTEKAGLVVDARKRPVAQVSYNGRVWAVDAAGKQTGEEIKP